MRVSRETTALFCLHVMLVVVGGGRWWKGRDSQDICHCPSSSSLSLTFSSAATDKTWLVTSSSSSKCIWVQTEADFTQKCCRYPSENQMKMIDGQDCGKSVTITDKYRSNEKLVTANSLNQFLEIG